MGKFVYYSNDEIKKWYDEYLICKSTASVSDLFNIGYDTIYRRLKKYRPKLQFHLCGTKSFLQEFIKILSKGCNVNGAIKISKVSSIFAIQYSGNINITKIRDFLYSGSLNEIEMDRKRNIVYADWLNEIVCNKPIRIKAVLLDGGEIIIFDSINSVNKFGFKSITERKVRQCLSDQTLSYKGYYWQYMLDGDKDG